MSSDEKSQQKFYIFGKDVFQVPCFKKTMFYSISSWISVGILTFLFTSKPAFASHCGFASYLIVSCGYFTHCRLNHFKQQQLANKLEDAILKKNIFEGTEYDEQKDYIKDLEEA